MWKGIAVHRMPAAEEKKDDHDGGGQSGSGGGGTGRDHDDDGGNNNNDDVRNINVMLYMLPTLDILITSLMVYLQFHFADTIYVTMCGKMDQWCLRCGLWFVRRVIIPNNAEDQLADHHSNTNHHHHNPNGNGDGIVDGGKKKKSSSWMESADFTITVHGHHMMESDTATTSTSHSKTIERQSSQSVRSNNDGGSSCSQTSMAEIEIVFDEINSSIPSRQSSLHGNGTPKLPQIAESKEFDGPHSSIDRNGIDTENKKSDCYPVTTDH